MEGTGLACSAAICRRTGPMTRHLKFSRMCDQLHTAAALEMVNATAKMAEHFDACTHRRGQHGNVRAVSRTLRRV
jgi:hypothetical protein